jgi:hypothetical protein
VSVLSLDKPRKKFARIKPAIMIGYAEGSKAIHKGFDIDSGRSLTTSNISFREDLDGFKFFLSKGSSDAARLPNQFNLYMRNNLQKLKTYPLNGQPETQLIHVRVV